MNHHRSPHEEPSDALPSLGGEELSLELPGLTLAARAWGPPEAPKVLALHGWLDNAGSFARLAPLLPEIRLVALDMAGHGRSGWRHASASYDFINWLPDVMRALDALGWQRCALLGHSLGAAVAVCFAGTLRDRVTRLALVDGMGPLSSPPEEAPERLGKTLRRQQRAANLRPPAYPDHGAMAERLCLAIDGLDSLAAENLLVRGSRPLGDDERASELTWSHDPRLRGSSLLRLDEAQVAAFMRRVRCPALLLRARGGWPVAEAFEAQRRAYIPQLDVQRVEGCHHVHLVTPERVAPPLASFFHQDGEPGKGGEADHG